MSFIDEDKLKEMRKKATEEIKNRVEKENKTIDIERWQRIQQRAAALGEFEEAEFYRVRENREPDPGFSDYELDEMMLDAMEKSAKFSKKSSSNITKINVDKLINIEVIEQSELKPEELLFLDYIHKKKIDKYNPEECNIAGYWTHDYNINIMKTLEKLFKSGYLTFKDITANISNASMDDLKSYLKKRTLPVSGTKKTLVSRILTNSPLTDLSDAFPIYSFDLTETGKQIINENQDLFIWHQMKNVLPINLDDLIAGKKFYQDLNGYELLVKLINDKIDLTTEKKQYSSISNAYYALAQLDEIYGSSQKAKIYYLFVAVLDEITEPNCILSNSLKIKIGNIDDNAINSCICLINQFDNTIAETTTYSAITNILNKVKTL